MLRVVPAGILLQTLYFKFSAAPESVYIFTTLGLEPHGRIGVGIAELVSGLLLLIPATTYLGAILGLGVIGGALFFHLTKLGIEVNGDGGYLFFLAVLVLVSCLALIWIERKKIPIISRIFN